jgi:hypothetical protein
MELLLNLLWLSLALPAFWIWGTRSVPARDSLARIRSLVFLGCAVVLLFPVVSATDDLRALRPDTEEVSISKCAVKRSPGIKSGTQPRDATSPAHSVVQTFFRPGYESSGLTFPGSIRFPETLSLGTSACRAPPCRGLA